MEYCLIVFHPVASSIVLYYSLTHINHAEIKSQLTATKKIRMCHLHQLTFMLIFNARILKFMASLVCIVRYTKQALLFSSENLYDN